MLVALLMQLVEGAIGLWNAKLRCHVRVTITRWVNVQRLSFAVTCHGFFIGIAPKQHIGAYFEKITLHDERSVTS